MHPKCGLMQQQDMPSIMPIRHCNTLPGLVVQYEHSCQKVSKQEMPLPCSQPGWLFALFCHTKHPGTLQGLNFPGPAQQLHALEQGGKWVHGVTVAPSAMEAFPTGQCSKSFTLCTRWLQSAVFRLAVDSQLLRRLVREAHDMGKT